MFEKSGYHIKNEHQETQLIFEFILIALGQVWQTFS